MVCHGDLTLENAVLPFGVVCDDFPAQSCVLVSLCVCLVCWCCVAWMELDISAEISAEDARVGINFRSFLSFIRVIPSAVREDCPSQFELATASGVKYGSPTYLSLFRPALHCFISGSNFSRRSQLMQKNIHDLNPGMFGVLDV